MAECRSFYRQFEIFLGCLFILAALSKAVELFHPSSITIGFWATPTVVAAEIQLEILLAAWIFACDRSYERSFVLMFCFATFAGVSLYESFHGARSCGCFGRVQVAPAVTAGFDILLVLAIWLTRPKRNDLVMRQISSRRLVWIAGLAVVTSSIFWSLILTRPVSANQTKISSGSTDGLVVLEPVSWINQDFPLFTEIDGSEPLRNGEWIVVFYHYDCDSCLAAIPKYQSLASRTGGNQVRVAFITMPPPAPSGGDPVVDSPNYLHLSLRPDHDWFATTPVVARLENGRVVSAAEGTGFVNP